MPRTAPYPSIAPALLCMVCGLAALGCSSGAGDQRLRIGSEPPGDDGSGGGAGVGSAQARDGGATSSEQALSVHVENIEKMTIEVITLACAGDCADVQAVAHGGNPPYAFEWEDGSTDATRHLCLQESATLEVNVTDTALDEEEFHYLAHTASVELTATVLECADAGVPATDAGQAQCDLGGGITLPEELTSSVTGMTVSYAGGAPLPPGRYRLEYVDGCFTCCITVDQFWLVTDSGVRVVTPPGGAPSNGMPLPVYQCPPAITDFPAVDFDFAGGTLSIMLTDVFAIDNQGGELSGSRNPTWRLSRLDCPR